LATILETEQKQPLPELTPERIESYILLMHTKCPTHNEWPVKVARSGQITFYCGCTRSKPTYES
jgi:hypothetical protein